MKTDTDKRASVLKTLNEERTRIKALVHSVVGHSVEFLDRFANQVSAWLVNGFPAVVQEAYAQS